MREISGLGQQSRKRLGQILRQAKGTVSVEEASDILRLSRAQTAGLLARWQAQGWLSRVRRGLYVPVPLESRSPDVVLEDPWIAAARLFAPCYIGGWSAQEHWGMTEQVFRSVMVVTSRRPRDRRPVIKGTPFVIRTVAPQAMFGTQPVWRGRVKVEVSDPTRTILDVLNDPEMAGGLRPAVDVLESYLKSPSRDLDQLLAYADRLGNGAVFKRLGFLLERLAFKEEKAITASRERMTQGNARLDPSVDNDRLMTRWRLWVPARWARESGHD
jgi:predicted transcriptional regulator of viral defense system